MKRAVLAAVLVAGSTVPAFAGGYIGLGIGPGPAVNAADLENDLPNDGRSGRLILGHSFGRLAIEGAIGKFDLILEDNGGGGPVYDVYQAQVGAKYSIPLSDGFEGYGRAGLHKMWFGNEQERYDAEGSGVLVGGGFEYRFKTGVGRFSIFVDYQLSYANVEGDVLKFGSTTARAWTLGATIGF